MDPFKNYQSYDKVVGNYEQRRHCMVLIAIPLTQFPLIYNLLELEYSNWTKVQSALLVRWFVDIWGI